MHGEAGRPNRPLNDNKTVPTKDNKALPCTARTRQVWLMLRGGNWVIACMRLEWLTVNGDEWCNTVCLQCIFVRPSLPCLLASWLAQRSYRFSHRLQPVMIQIPNHTTSMTHRPVIEARVVLIRPYSTAQSPADGFRHMNCAESHSNFHLSSLFINY